MKVRGSYVRCQTDGIYRRMMIIRRVRDRFKDGFKAELAMVLVAAWAEN
jgi:hypothetical protein